MRIAVIAAGGVGNFGLTFARAGVDMAFVGRGTPSTVTQADGVKPIRQTNALIKPGQPPSSIPTAVTPCARNKPA